MEELYWITRLEPLTILISVLTGLLSFIVVANIVVSIFTDKDSERNIKIRRGAFIHRFWMIPLLTTFVLILIFVPNKKDAFMIYGLGTTIDYVKSNEKIKELPDKSIEALDKLLNEYLEEK